jgi:hypothetical protein
MLWWPIFFLTAVLAEENITEKYCFKSSFQAGRAIQQLKSISLPMDTIQNIGECISVSTKPSRIELIQRFIQSNHPEMSVVFSSQFAPKEPCDLKIEKIISKQSDKDEKKPESSEILHITTVDEFELKLKSFKVIGYCKNINSKLYEIRLKVSKKTLEKSDSSITFISSSTEEDSFNLEKFDLRHGEQIDIGEQIKDQLKNEDEIINSVQSPSTTTVKSDNEKIILSIN